MLLLLLSCTSSCAQLTTHVTACAQLITHVAAFAVAQGEALAGMEAGQGRLAVQAHVCSGSTSDAVCCMRSSACT